MKVFLTIDETNPSKPAAVLHVLGNELALSECQLNDLQAEIHWAKDIISAVRKREWEALATKYKEIQRA